MGGFVKKMVTAIIVAAGKGERLAACDDKPFVKLNDRPIVSYSLSLFEEIKEISSVILVISKKKMDEAAALVNRCGLSKVGKLSLIHI